MSNSQDFYDLLEVSKDASPSEIKKSYRQLARKYHPDNKETGSEELFKKIQEAYEVLSDERKRGMYDRVGHQAYSDAGNRMQQGGHGQYNSGDLFEDIFRTFFGDSMDFGGGMGNPRSRVSRGADYQQILQIQFLDACYGITKPIDVDRQVSCDTCNGSGSDSAHPPSDCPTCSGQGEIRSSTQSIFGMVTQVSTCPKCRGTGQLITHPCKTCHGEKYVQSSESIDITIPAGVESGMRLVIRGKGNDGNNGGPPGDLYLLLEVAPHEIFSRSGIDISQEININVWQAIMGDELKISTIHGEETVKLTSGTQSGDTITLKNKGIHLQNGQKGNHYLHIKVKIPKSKDLSKEIIDIISEEMIGQNTDDTDNTSNKNNIFKNLFNKS